MCATLLLCISHPSGQHASYAADDDSAWQGTVKVVYSSHAETNKTESYPPATTTHAYQVRRDTTATYTGFHILPENEEMRSWVGSANVNLTLNRMFTSDLLR